jgi:hypothetical protein
MFDDFYYYRANRYSRSAAVRYAVTYALKPNPAYRYFPLINDTSGDCANFLSQCLRAGGAPLTYAPGHVWWYNSKGNSNVNDDSWSVSWTVAHSLYWYLKINQASGFSGVKGLEVESQSQLELGDLIFFEDRTGLIFHSSIVTGFSNGTPLVSHHSYEALNIPYTRSWPAGKYHFLKVSI